MSMTEKMLRPFGHGFIVAAPLSVPAWLIGVHVVAVVLTIVASVCLLVVALWYAGWALGHEGSGGRYEASHLGAGRTAHGGSPIYMCPPYLVWGRRFRRRVQVRRIRELEKACGLDNDSAFTRGLS